MTADDHFNHMCEYVEEIVALGLDEYDADDARACVEYAGGTWDLAAWVVAVHSMTVRNDLLADWRNVHKYEDVPVGANTAALAEQLTDLADGELTDAVKTLATRKEEAA